MDIDQARNSTNDIHTTRFTMATWLPKSLKMQFTRVANVYFASVGILAVLPSIGQGQEAKSVTVLCVFLIQALKDLWEDSKRGRDDNTENMQSCEVYDCDSQNFAAQHFQEVRVGALIKVTKGKPVPADILVLASSEDTGKQ